MIKDYYQLTKPGIIYGNAVTAAAGFLLASRSHVSWRLLAVTLIGISLVIASGCVFNNYLDRSIDQRMARTRRRALVTGAISGSSALTYATLLGVIGFAVLALGTNALTVIVGLVGIFFYVVVYGFYKRRSSVSTIVGSISGAIPPVAGYCAVSGRFDLAALILFLIMAFWQLPHFYAIAIYRLDDYAAAKLPVLPVRYGVHTTKLHLLASIVAFGVAAIMLAYLHYAGYTYLATVTALSLIWLILAIRGFRAGDDKAWARRMFSFSLIVIMLLSIVMSANAILV